MELRRWIQVLCILPALQDFLDFQVYSMVCPEDTHYLMTQRGSERCCKKCPAGSMVEQHCTNGTRNTTKCKRCPDGRYQSIPNGEKMCHMCARQIKSNRRLLTNCTRFTNKEYGACNEGYYHDKSFDFCVKCTSCPVGYGVTKACTKDTDTECTEEKCPMGTFSDKESWTQRCKLCTRCRNNQEMYRECTHSTNYECKERKTLTPTTPTKESLITNSKSTNLNTVVVALTDAVQKGPTDDSRSWVMPFFVTAMILLLILFVALVIIGAIWGYSQIQSRNRRENVIVQAEDPQSVQRLTKFVDDIESVCLPNEGQYDYPAEPESKPVTIQDNGVMIRDVSHDIIEELANYLNPTNPPSNWRKVASTLDFPWNVINNMALSPTTATQQLLERWGTKRDSTVYRLYEILKDIGRDDAAEVLERLFAEPVPSCPKSV